VQTTTRMLVVAVGCLLSIQAHGAPSSVRLTEGQTTFLRVGELAVLRIPTDRRYTYRPKLGPDGAWREVLTAVRRSRREVLFRATAAGRGVVLLTPDVPRGECISCVTRRYFVEVAPSRRSH
jgi:hypothetical protein